MNKAAFDIAFIFFSLGFNLMFFVNNFTAVISILWFSVEGRTVTVVSTSASQQEAAHRAQTCVEFMFFMYWFTGLLP